jgi:hypothetical protein
MRLAGLDSENQAASDLSLMICDMLVLTHTVIMYIEVRQHNFVYLRNINKLYF